MNKYIFVIVGVGGIGGNVARDLPKLLINRPDKMILIDGDSVDKSNCVRQPYQKQDIGFNKARILAKKINSFYKVNCMFFDSFITDLELDVICNKNKDYIPVFIGCVDNDATRKIIENSYLRQNNSYLIDGANSEYEGNIYSSKIINGLKKGPIRSEFYKLDNDINPGLAGCENLVAKGELQYLITNNKIAAFILEHIHSLISELDEWEGVTVIERFKAIRY